MNYKSACCLALAGSAAWSQASFDLLMQGDTFSNIGIQRIDGETHSEFGRIAPGYGNVIAMALDQSAGRIYSLIRPLDAKGSPQSAILYSHNYNTGEYLNERPASGMTAIGFANGRIYAAGNGFLDTYDPNSLGTVSSTSFAVGVLAMAGSGSNLVVRLADQILLNQSGVFTSSISVAAATSACLAIADNRIVSGDTSSRLRLGITSSTLTLLGTFTTPGLNTVTGLAFGHGNRFYASFNDTTLGVSTIRGYSFVNGALSGPGGNHTARGGPLVNVVAPEPASLLALSGLAALARRRRRQS